MEPLPYSGHREVRRNRIGESYVERTLDTDVSGTRTYAYNRLGYRGPEYRANAALTVFTFGESDAIGTGLEFEESWPARVVAREAEARGIDPSDVCHMNFAEPGASNAYIARSVLSQCGVVRPDLVLVNFASFDRTEGIAGGRAYPIGDWLDGPGADAALREAPEEGGLRARLREQLDRGRHYRAFATGRGEIYASLRDMLLVQFYLRSEGIPAVAVCREREKLDFAGARADAVLGPLLGQVDESFLAPFDITWVAESGAHGVDDQHYDARTHDALAERVFQFLHGRVDDRPGSTIGARAHARRLVKAFYDEMPFNFHGAVENSVEAVEGNAVAATYPDLDAHLRSSSVRRVLELGCGAGWLANTIARHYGTTVDAVDFCGKALDRAREVSRVVGTLDRTRFVEADLFEFECDKPYDLVVSLGVLHHTGDPAGTVRHAASLVRPGGHFYLGLYHAPGRRVFLGILQEIARKEGEEAAFRRYRQLDRVHRGDETLLRSWFRDQVLHPHETQHTLRETLAWLEGGEYELVSTSINRFRPFDRVEDLFAEELTYERKAWNAIVRENRYFPGFFTALFERRELDGADGM